jgi:hypothetical protein
MLRLNGQELSPFDLVVLTDENQADRRGDKDDNRT